MTTSASAIAERPAALDDPAAALAQHFDALRDACAPALRFDRAGLPFAAWQATLRSRLREALGLPPASAAAQTEGAATIALRGGREEAWQEGAGYRWQRVWLQTEPELWVPGFFA